MKVMHGRYDINILIFRLDFSSTKTQPVVAWGRNFQPLVQRWGQLAPGLFTLGRFSGVSVAGPNDRFVFCSEITRKNIFSGRIFRIQLGRSASPEIQIIQKYDGVEQPTTKKFK